MISRTEHTGGGYRGSVRLAWVSLLAAVLAVALSGCGGDDRSEPGAAPDTAAEASVALEASADDVRTAAQRKTFVGKVDGTDAYIALSVTPGRPLRAYVCDGKNITQWFTGSVEGDRVQAAADKADGTLTATGGDTGFTGTVVLAGASHPFRVEAARDPAGLYQAGDPTREIRGAWIVLPDGSQRGAGTKEGVATESTVSPESGTADIGGDTVEAGSGGGGGGTGTGQVVTPLAYPKKIASTCQKLESGYNTNLAGYNEATAKGDKELADSFKSMMDGILARMVKIGCISF